MRVREAGRPGGLVALLLLASCSGPGTPALPVRTDRAQSAEALRGLLGEIEGRKDYEAAIGRARIYSKLRALEEPDGSEILIRGDGADIEVLSQPAPPEYKREASGRLARHFAERAEAVGLRRSSFAGPLAEPIHRFVLLSIAAAFADYVSPADHAATLGRLAEAAEQVAEAKGIRSEQAESWWKRARARRSAAENLPAGDVPNPRARRFCEADPARHLEEANRAADLGTAEKVARGEASSVVEWWLEALARYVLVAEVRLDPSADEKNALAAMDIVVRNLTDLICGKP